MAPLSRSEPPKIPPGKRIYAIGDLHGRADLLEICARAIARGLDHFDGEALTVTLGDVIDRGPDSAAVIARLRLNDFPTPVLALRGNHEQVMLDAQYDARAFAHWLDFGGVETLASFGVDARLGFRACAEFLRDRAAEDLAFLAQSPFSYSCGDYFFCHAGVRPGIALSAQQPDDLMTVRREFLTSTLWHGQRVVHGHTPVTEPEIRPNRVGLDLGAFARGRLGCAAFEADSLRLIDVFLAAV